MKSLFPLRAATADGTCRYRLADLDIPGEPLHNPFAQAAYDLVRRTAQRLGLLVNEEDFLTFEGFISLSGFVFPLATLAQLTACAAFSSWLWFLDNRYDENPELAADECRVRNLIETNVEVLATGELSSQSVGDPMAKYSIFTHRSLMATAIGGQAWMHRFAANVREAFYQGCLPAVRAYRERCVPDLETFMRLRLLDGGAYPAIDASEIALGIFLPEKSYRTAPVQEMRKRCSEVMCFTNDLFSFEREDGYGNPNNLLQCLMANRSLSLADALHAAVGIIHDSIRKFDFQAQLADSERNPILARYVEGMRHWMRGNLDFSRKTHRYPVSRLQALKKQAGSEGGDDRESE